MKSMTFKERSEKGKEILSNLPPSSYEQMKAQVDESTKRSEISFAKNAPIVQAEIKKIKAPLNPEDSRYIARAIFRKQATLNMLDKEVLNEFKKTELYKKLIKASEG